MNINVQTTPAQLSALPVQTFALPANISLQDLLQAAEQLCRAKAPPMEWGVFKMEFYAYIEAENEPNTIAHFKRAIRYLEQFKEIKYLSDITPELLQNFKHWLMKIYPGNAGINRSVRGIKTMMRWAERKKFIAPQDWNIVQLLRESKGRLLFYTEEEIKLLLCAAKGQWKLVILLGARAGLRRGEIANLKWCDIDFPNNQLFIAARKTDKHRYVPISADLRDMLEVFVCCRINEYVINVGQCGRDKPYWLGSFFYKILAKAGIVGKGCIHTLRHTFASHLVQNGVDLYTVSKLMGHSSIKITEIYAHLAAKTLQTAVNKLPAI